MKPDIPQYLERHGVRYEDEEAEIDKVVVEVDVVYQTRIRPQRAAAVSGNMRHSLRYAIDSSVLAAGDALRRDGASHPLPRTVELDKTVDEDPRAMYFRQAANGLYVRMALLTMLLDG